MPSSRGEIERDREADIRHDFFYECVTEEDVRVHNLFPNDLDRLRYYNSILNDESFLPAVQDPAEFFESKSNLTAHTKLAYFREIHRDGDFRKCLELLNEVLTLADSEIYLKSAYKIRAFVYAQLGYYAMSRKNLNLSMRSIRGTSEAPQLHRSLSEPHVNDLGRRAQSMIWTRILEIPRLPFTPQRLSKILNVHHPNLRPNKLGGEIDPAVQLRQRYDGLPLRVVSNCAMAVGRVIAVDRSLCTILDPDARLKRCASCLEECRLGLQPCRNCRSLMFCCHNCEQNINSHGFHVDECKIARYLFDEAPEMRMVVRVLLTTFKKPADVADMMLHCADGDNATATDLWVPYNFFAIHNRKKKPKSHIAKLVYALRFHPQYAKPPIGDQILLCRQSAYLYRVLQQRTGFIQRVCPERAQRRFMLGFIYDLVQVLQAFAAKPHRLWSSMLFAGESLEPRNATIGLFPLWCTFKHSCSPNVAIMPVGPDRLLFCALRPIAANEELTIDRTFDLYHRYDDMHKIGQIHTEILQSMFRIKCKCSVETVRRRYLPFPHQYSRLAQIQFFYYNSLTTREQILIEIFSQQTSVVHVMFRYLCDYLTESDRHNPCRQLHEAREYYDFCLHHMYGPNIEMDIGVTNVGAMLNVDELDLLGPQLLGARMGERVNEWLSTVAPGTPTDVDSGTTTSTDTTRFCRFF